MTEKEQFYMNNVVDTKHDQRYFVLMDANDSKFVSKYYDFIVLTDDFNEAKKFTSIEAAKDVAESHKGVFCILEYRGMFGRV